MNKNNTKKELLEHIGMLEHVIETNRANNALRQLNHVQMVSRIKEFVNAIEDEMKLCKEASENPYRDNHKTNHDRGMVEAYENVIDDLKQILEHNTETNKVNNVLRNRIESEMKKYLYNHNYISEKKTCNQQEELSQERAECIINKIISVIEEG